MTPRDAERPSLIESRDIETLCRTIRVALCSKNGHSFLWTWAVPDERRKAALGALEELATRAGTDGRA